jgi:hypothetical protein
LVSRIGASPVWRAGLASAFILGLAGFAAVVIPTACRNGFVVCQASTGPVVAPLADQLAPVAETAPSTELVAVNDIAPLPEADTVASAKSMATAMIKQEPAALTRNDLIAQTFAALDVELTTTSGELTARKVRTVSIGPDGMPILDSAPAAPAVADEPAPIVVAEAEPEPAPVVSEEPVAEEPVVAAEEEPTASAYAPVGRGNAVVGRQGANVRTLPKTGGSQVLFALAAGEEVTVTETQKGWLKVVDSRGRSGWIWSALVRR